MVSEPPLFSTSADEPEARRSPPKKALNKLLLPAAAIAIVAVVILGVALSGVLSGPTGGAKDNNDGQNDGTDDASDDAASTLPDWYLDYLNQTASGNPNSTTDPPGTAVNEPVVVLGWQQGSEPPGASSTPEQYYHWSFAQSQTVVLTNKVNGPADRAKIANVVKFPGLTPDEVGVTVNAASGPPLVVNLWDDGDGGCFGLLVDSTANIQGEKAWTWEYSSARTSYSISINIVFYELGYQSFTVLAFDQDTGKRVSAADLTAPSHVWGRELLTSNTRVGTWSGTPNPEATGVVVNYTLHDEMSSLAQQHYSGTIKDVVYFEGVSVRVWGIINGAPVLWNPTSEGKYEFYWENFNGASSHEFRIQVEFQTPLPTEYGDAIMHYAVLDNSSGENLLGYFGGGHSDIWVYLQWPTSNG